MSTIIRPAQDDDACAITELVNRYAEQNITLPRSEENVRQTLADWLVAVETRVDTEGMAREHVVGCGSLVPLTDELVEVRSLALDESQQGQGVGSKMVLALVEIARKRNFAQVCALTLTEGFFTKLGFELVDRWHVSPKVWQACIYCPKFHRCDEVAVLMNLVEQPVKKGEQRSKARNSLLKWGEWQPLRLAYQQRNNPMPHRHDDTR